MSKKRLARPSADPTLPQVLARLPRRAETWAVAAARLRIWITPKDRPPFRPYTLALWSPDRDLLLGAELFDHYPAPGEVLRMLHQAMAAPKKDARPARRPARVACADPALAAGLAADLAEIGVACETEELPGLPELIADLELDMRQGEPEPLGLLSVPGVTPELAAGFFAAAAEYYRAAPWLHLANEQPIALTIPAGSGTERIAVVMGNDGIDYGLAAYGSWAEYEQTLTGDPAAILPQGQLAMTFDSVVELPFPDLDALEQYGWPVAGELAYPVPGVFYPEDWARRPEPDELAWLEVALRALAALVPGRLQPGEPGDWQPFDVTLTVRAHAGDTAVRARYPAGVVAVERRAGWEVPSPQGEGVEGVDAPLLPDRRAMEGAMAQLVGQLPGVELPGDPQVQAAQRLMYQAWEATDPARRLALAHQALEVSADCADAYVLLAQEEARTLAEALELCRQGVAAGERALGPEYFEQERGHFWDLLETRPYMRAREGLAYSLWRAGRREEALEHYYALLDLNENDNQGMRYVLAELLLELDRDAELLALLKRFPDDVSAQWPYTWALVEFRRGGASRAAGRRLRAALNANPHVPAYLLGHKRVPPQAPDYIGFGDDSEAAAYAGDFIMHWRRTPGAVEWLQANL